MKQNSFPKKQVISRYHIIAFLLVLLSLIVIGKLVYLMFFEKSKWMEKTENYSKTDKIKPTRGNIYSADGQQLLATSVPEYKLFIDYLVVDKNSKLQEKYQHKRDTMILNNVDRMSEGLHQILPDKSANWFKDRIMKGFHKRTESGERVRCWYIYPKPLSYLKYKQVCELPYFRENRNISGFGIEPHYKSVKMYGSLASRTLGDVNIDTDSAYSGLQLVYDTILRGEPGDSHKVRIFNRYIPIIDTPPVDGVDLYTTIDIGLQDFCEKAIVEKLKDMNAETGIVILMEVATGDIKAITTQSLCSDGVYRERENLAVCNMMEPGSVFKPISIMVALEDGKISLNSNVDTGSGIKAMHGRKMKDHNWNNGGYGVIDVPHILGYSSNIGVSELIDRNYFNNPQKYVEGLYKIGIAEDLNLDFPEYKAPRIRMPKKDKSNWSKTALAWMSIGYETQVPPISILNFYNGVANGGKMMRPRIVKSAVKSNNTVYEYPTTVIREKMCSEKTLKDVQYCLRYVVDKGLGKKAGSKKFPVSGKTGTAQVWAKGGNTGKHLVSFVGYYPSNAPKYSCIVCIIKQGTASGGGDCGPVFSKIAEKAMAVSESNSLKNYTDTLNNHTPLVMDGNAQYANNVLTDLGLDNLMDWQKDKNNKNPWAEMKYSNNGIEIYSKPVSPKIMPNVIGMGARDAVFLLEELKLKVKINGFGRVMAQSIPYGKHIKSGDKVVLQLSHSSKPISKPIPTKKDTINL